MKSSMKNLTLSLACCTFGLAQILGCNAEPEPAEARASSESHLDSAPGVETTIYAATDHDVEANLYVRFPDDLRDLCGPGADVNIRFVFDEASPQRLHLYNLYMSTRMESDGLITGSLQFTSPSLYVSDTQFRDGLWTNGSGLGFLVDVASEGDFDAWFDVYGVRTSYEGISQPNVPLGPDERPEVDPYRCVSLVKVHVKAPQNVEGG